MPNPTIGFFNTASALVAELGLDATWTLQNDNVASQSDRLQGLGADGDEAASDLVNKRENVSLVLKCFETTGTLVLPSIGTVTSTGHHLDSMALALVPNDWPTLTIPLHKHDNGSSHTPGSCRTYTPTLEINAGRGIPRAVAGAASADYLGGFNLASTDTALGIASVNYNFAVTHQDEALPNWIAGENRDGVETFDITLTGKGATITAPADWDKLSNGDARGNTAAETETASYEHHVAFDVEAPPEG